MEVDCIRAVEDSPVEEDTPAEEDTLVEGPAVGDFPAERNYILVVESIPVEEGKPGLGPLVLEYQELGTLKQMLQ